MRSRSNRVVLFVFAALVFCGCRAAQPTTTPRSPFAEAAALLRHDIDATLNAPDLERASWGVVVTSLRSGDTLYTRNAQKLMMPASCLKLITLAAAAERLGWDFTYQTRLVATGPIVEGVLDGDLVVIGSGDPSIVDGGTAFSSWSEQLKGLGIRAIAGRVIGDDRAFTGAALGAGWSWDDVQDGYAAPVGALQYNENVVRMTVSPGPATGMPPAVSLLPDGSGLVVSNLMTSGAPGSAPLVEARRLPGSHRLTLRGSVPIGVPPLTRAVTVESPARFFVTALRNRLAADGIDVRGPAAIVDEITDSAGDAPGTPLFVHRSPTLSALAVTLMKRSQNLYAETLLKTLGASAGTASADGGRAAVRSILEGWGVAATDVIQADGSGLSRYSYVTPNALVAVLRHVAASDVLRPPFDSALPVAGRDGTLAARMADPTLDGAVRAKTGSLSGVRTLAGYVTTRDGEPLAFAIMANGFGPPSEPVTRAIDAVASRLARFSRR